MNEPTKEPTIDEKINGANKFITDLTAQIGTLTIATRGAENAAAVLKNQADACQAEIQRQTTARDQLIAEKAKAETDKPKLVTSDSKA